MIDSWWRHQMETFSALLAICAGNSPVTGEFPTQRPVTRSFDFYFDLRPNERLNKQSWGWWFETLSSPLWRHRNVLRYSRWQNRLLSNACGKAVQGGCESVYQHGGARRPMCPWQESHHKIINRVKSVQYLLMSLDKNLNWHDLVDQICMKYFGTFNHIKSLFPYEYENSSIMPLFILVYNTVYRSVWIMR